MYFLFETFSKDMLKAVLAIILQAVNGKNNFRNLLIYDNR